MEVRIRTVSITTSFRREGCITAVNVALVQKLEMDVLIVRLKTKVILEDSAACCTPQRIILVDGHIFFLDEFVKVRWFLFALGMGIECRWRCCWWLGLFVFIFVVVVVIIDEDLIIEGFLFDCWNIGLRFHNWFRFAFRLIDFSRFLFYNFFGWVLLC